MSVSQKIQKKIEKIKEGTTIRYKNLSIEIKEYSAAAKTIERLIKKGSIERISKGVFFKPKQTVFGKIKPGENELLKTYLFKDGKRIAYITGLSLFNSLGLTSQVPKIIKISSRDKRIFATLGNTKGKPVKSYIDVTDDNYYLLEILDVIKDFKKIPDLNKRLGIKILNDKIKKLEKKEIKLLLKYALKYPPRTKALLGSIIEELDSTINLKILKKSLNPLTKYDFNISGEFLPNKKNWNIR